MKYIHQNLRFSIHASLLALLCCAITPTARANHIIQSAYNNSDVDYSSQTMAETSNQSAANQSSIPIKQLILADNSINEEADFQARRQKMIEHCEDNRGVDCEKKVDTELEAEQLDNNTVIYQDGRLRPRPRPRPR